MTTESDLWNRLRPQFIKAGALPIRLENAANLSVPDVVLVGRERAIWLELKIAKGNKIYIPKFQYAFGVQLAKQVLPELFWIVTVITETVCCIPYLSIVEHIRKGDGKTVSFDVRSTLMWKLDYVLTFLGPQEREINYE